MAVSTTLTRRPHHRTTRVLVAVMAVLGVVSASLSAGAAVGGPQAPDWVVTTTDFFAPAATAEDQFGLAVDTASSVAAVGAPGAAGTGLTGRVIVYELAGGVWSQTAELSSPTPTPGGSFGYAVAVDATNPSGSRIVVGERRPGGNGLAHVFSNTTGTWQLTTTLDAQGLGSTDDRFGSAVAIEGDTVVVGARNDDQAGPNAGAAYQFDVPTTGPVSLTRKLVSPTPTTNALYGDVVAISSGRVLVGAPLEKVSTFSLAGNLHIHDAATGSVIATLQPNDRQSYHGFGTEVSVSDGFIFVGANGDNGPTPGVACSGSASQSCPPGAVYVFADAPGFTQTQQLHAPDGADTAIWAPGSQYGLSIDADNGRMTTGARYADVPAAGGGRVYVYELNTTTSQWEPTITHTPDTVRGGDLYGQDVALTTTGDIWVGAPGNDLVNGLAARNEGAVTLIELTPRFATTSTLTLGTDPAPIVTIDLQAHGEPAIVVGNVISETLSVITNNGSTLTNSPDISLEGKPTGIAVGDLDQDGMQDVAVAMREGRRGVAVLWGTPTGLSAPQFVPAGPRPHRIAIGSVTAGAAPDLIVSHCCGGSANTFVNVIPNNGNRTFGTPIELPTNGGIAVELAVIDLNLDGQVDVLSHDPANNAIVGWISQPATNTFTAPIRHNAPNDAFAVTNLTTNTPTIVVATGQTTITSYPINPQPNSFTLGTPTTITTPINVDRIDTGQLNGDTTPDLILLDRTHNQFSVVLAAPNPHIGPAITTTPIPERAAAITITPTSQPTIAMVSRPLTTPSTGQLTLHN